MWLWILDVISIGAGGAAAVMWWQASTLTVAPTSNLGSDGFAPASVNDGATEVVATLRESSKANADAALFACVASGAQVVKLLMGVVESLQGCMV